MTTLTPNRLTEPHTMDEAGEQTILAGAPVGAADARTGRPRRLIELLHAAFERNLLDADALGMIEGVLQVGELSVRDIAIPRSQMDVIRVSESVAHFLPFVLDTAHSRFPVIGRDRTMCWASCWPRMALLPTRTPLTCATACARRCSSPNQTPERAAEGFRSRNP